MYYTNSFKIISKIILLFFIYELFLFSLQNLVFGLIISHNQLISLVRMKKILLHPADLHLIFNLVNATESLKSSENWMPICLPKFDPT